MRVKLTLLSVVILTLSSSLTYAGTAGYEYVRSEDLTMLGIDVGDVAYDFNGSVDVPFTLSGTNATVYLAIYTTDQATAGGYGGPGRPEWNGGHSLLRRAGIPNMVRVVECGQYDVGSGSCAWDGTDWGGEDVAPGTYRLYVLGYDNISDANWVAVTGYGFRMRSSEVKVMQGQGYMHMVTAQLGRHGGDGPRGHVTHGMGGGFSLYPLPLGNLLDADDPYDLLAPFTTELPETGLTNDDGDPTAVLGGQSHGVAIDPEDFSRNWMYGYSGVGVTGVTIDWDSQTSEPMAGFGEPPASWQKQIAQGDHASFFFSVQYYEGFLYMGNGWLNDPPAAGIYELDSSTGEVTDIIDVSEWMVFEQYGHDPENTETTLAASMINCISIDSQGFVMAAGGWGPSSINSVPTKVDWNGDLIYQNDRGDGFNDNIWAGEAQALGVESTTDGESHAVSISRGEIPGFVFMTEASKGDMSRQPSFGGVYGPDGSGIFHAQGPNIALSNHEATGSGTNMIHEQSDWDGLYILTAEKAVSAESGWNDEFGGYQIAHWPFRIEQALIGTDFATAIAEVSSDVTPEEVELGDAYPNPFNPATTIEFAIPTNGHATVKVLNTQGQVVNTLVNEFVSAGTYRTTWDGMNANGELAAGGLYFYRLQVGGQEVTKKMTFLK
jgi:flagellar hook assembly protein FlgD